MAQSQMCVFKVDHVHFQLPYATHSDCSVQLFQTQICAIQGGQTKLTLPLHRIRSIEIHQPIFGANYISGEYVEEDSTNSFTITFNKGGATDFARAFFRLTEGQLVTSTAPKEPTVSSENKKTK